MAKFVAFPDSSIKYFIPSFEAAYLPRKGESVVGFFCHAEFQVDSQQLRIAFIINQELVGPLEKLDS